MSGLAAGLRPPNRLQLAVIATIGASGGLVALHAEASLLAVLVATVLGLVVGAALTAYLTWILPMPDEDRRRQF